VARWSLVLAERAHTSWVYPVAKINSTGSGSNKFCLAKLLHARTFGLVHLMIE
jgi:hypothetical protein